jgi:hypothetical protein
MRRSSTSQPSDAGTMRSQPAVPSKQAPNMPFASGMPFQRVRLWPPVAVAAPTVSRSITASAGKSRRILVITSPFKGCW